MPGTSTKRACFTLKSSQLEMLRGRSRQTGAPVAELVRRSVDAYLEAEVVGDRLDADPVRADPAPTDRLDDAGHEMTRDKDERVGELLRILGFPDVDLEMRPRSRRSPRRHAGPLS